MTPINELVIKPVTGVWKDISGQTRADRAAKTASSAAQTQAGYQQQALDYLKEREELPQHYREQALAKLGGLYGIQGVGAGDSPAPGQEQMVQDIMQSPLYGALMSGKDAGEEAILRHAASTGGLRKIFMIITHKCKIKHCLTYTINVSLD